MRDARYALRSLSRSPVFALGAIGTLALGIGVNSTIFTLANAVFFHPMPAISAPSQLVWLSGVWREQGRAGGMSYPEYIDYRAASAQLFSSVLAYAPAPFSLGSGGEPERIRGHLVSGSYFETLGVTPSAGRLLQPSDDRPGAPPAAVISDRLWRRHFGGAEIPGRPLAINGRQVTVVGIAPADFTGPELGQAADIWMAIALLPEINTPQARWLGDRGTMWLRVMGRLRPAATIPQAQAAFTGVAAALDDTYPANSGTRGILISDASSGLRPSERSEFIPLAALLLTVTGLVLLIACANVANLLLARGAGRSLEMSIRAAVGASRWRLVRQLLTESVVLAAVGAAAGLLLSFWTSDFLAARLPELDFRGLQTGADGRVLLFTAALAGASVCVFGVAPALTSTRAALQPRLRQTPSAGGGRSRVQDLFVVTQLSLSLVLLLAAGLSLRALQKANDMELGFNSDHLSTASYDLTLQNYPIERRAAFRRDLLARLEALPATSSATLCDVPPLSGTMVGTMVAVTHGEQVIEARAFMSSIGPRYFETLEIPLVKGRGITDDDRAGTPDAAVINETLAHRLWPGADPIGNTFRFDDQTVQVVGVARDAKYDEATERATPFVYLSLAQHAQLDRETVIVRSGDALAAAAIRGQIRALDPLLPVFEVRRFDSVLRDRADKQRALSVVFAGFGGLALLLASMGLYGLMAYTVTQRTREIGVRLALGATPRQLIALIAAGGLRLTLVGVAIGALLALPLAGLLGAVVFGIGIADIGTFAGICLLLVAVAMAAALLPARRAARLDPIAALRAE